MAKQDSTDSPTAGSGASDVSNVTPIDRARRTLESQVDTAKEKAAEVASEVSERLGDVSASARRYSEKAREQAREQVDLRAQQARETYGHVQHSMSEASGDLAVFVRDSPGRAVLIATAAGFLIGLLFRGRKS